MFIDIVFPKNNEEEFLEIAEKLGSKLCFAYTEKEFKKKKEKYEFACCYNSNTKDAFVISDRAERGSFENSRINLIFDLEKSPSNDRIHQRESGFNHILAKITKEKNKFIGFNFSLILNTDTKERARLLGRMMQNVKICRKYKVNIYVGSFAREPYELRGFSELRSFGVCLGMNPGEMKELKL